MLPPYCAMDPGGASLAIALETKRLNESKIQKTGRPSLAKSFETSLNNFMRCFKDLSMLVRGLKLVAFET